MGNDETKEAFVIGYEKGYDRGYDKGWQAGFLKAKEEMQKKLEEIKED